MPLLTGPRVCISNRRLLLSLADAGGRVMYAYKDLLELAGLTTRLYTLLSTLHNLPPLPSTENGDVIELVNVDIGIPPTNVTGAEDVDLEGHEWVQEPHDYREQWCWKDCRSTSLGGPVGWPRIAFIGVSTISISHGRIKWQTPICRHCRATACVHGDGIPPRSDNISPQLF